MKKTKKRRATRFFMAKDLLAFFGPEPQMALIAEKLDCCRETLYKWIQNDVKISEWAADRYAITLGIHPSEIWSDWFEE